MDTRLVPPALTVWVGAALTYLYTGWADTIYERHDRAHHIFVAGCALLFVVLTLGVLFRNQRARHVLAIAMGALFISAIVTTTHISAQTSEPLAGWVTSKQQVTVLGLITSEGRTKATPAGAAWKTAEVQEFVMASTAIYDGTRTYPIELPLTLEIGIEYALPPIGTEVILTGKLGQSFRYGNFAAAITGVADIRSVSQPGVVDSIADSMRNGLRKALMGIDPRPGSLVAGLAIGDESAMPDQLRDQMRTTGLAHLTAVSGGNVAIVLALVVGLCVSLRIRLVGRVVISLVALGFYVVLVQPQPSVLRAATMGAIVVLSLLVGGRRAGPSILSMAIIILILFDPSLSIAWGFALSVAATAGIIMLTPVLLDRAQQSRVFQRFPPIVLAAGLLTLSAQIATLPVLIAMGAPISLGSVPANVLAMPMVPFITIGGLFSSLVSPLSIPLGHVFAVLASWPAAWISGLASFFNSWPTFTGVQLVAGLLLLGGVVVVARQLKRKQVLLVAPVLLASVFILRSCNPWLPEHWVMVACDVGQGDAIVLRDFSDSSDPNGATIVVDVGPTPTLINDCLNELGVGTIEAIIISHYHRDHVGGISGALRGRTVKGIYATPYQEPADQFDYATAVIPAGMRIETMQSGQVWQLGESRLEVFWPERILTDGSMPNNASVVLIFETKGKKILLTGDIEREAQQAIMRAHQPVNADVIKVPHHGSANLDPDFSEWAGGSVAVISVGADNDYGHPSRESLEAWQGATTFRTDLQGAIAISVGDSSELQVTTKR